MGCVAAFDALLVFGRPPQPLELGTVQWFYEVGVTVDRVDRAASIGSGASTIRPKGEYYIVHARIIAPFGVRPVWQDSDVEVRTFSGSGGTMRDLRFTVAEDAQVELDRKTGRPGPRHLVRGAEQHEDLVFDLPRNVEQPALVFLPANDPLAMLGLIAGNLWQPHRFNLRYD
ncbi:MAG: hypothetical protein ABI282_01165 [Candidatus Baltobacteraceae bacterium]